MNSRVIRHRASKPVFTGFGRTEKLATKSGIECKWKQYIKSVDDKFRCEWFFDWEALEEKGAKNVDGVIKVTLFDKDRNSETHEIKVNMEEPTQKIMKVFRRRTPRSRMTYACSATFSYELTVSYGENE